MLPRCFSRFMFLCRFYSTAILLQPTGKKAVKLDSFGGDSQTIWLRMKRTIQIVHYPFGETSCNDGD
jgi:hypothetical protein